MRLKITNRESKPVFTDSHSHNFNHINNNNTNNNNKNKNNNIDNNDNDNDNNSHGCCTIGLSVAKAYYNRKKGKSEKSI